MLKKILSRIDPWLRKVGLYTAYTLGTDEYIGTMGEEMFKRIKETSETTNLEAVKYHPGTGDIHDWSGRIIDPEDRRKQYHIHAWESGKGKFTVYSHREFRPDLHPISWPDESLYETYKRLRTHYRPNTGPLAVDGSTYKEGAFDWGLIDEYSRD